MRWLGIAIVLVTIGIGAFELNRQRGLGRPAPGGASRDSTPFPAAALAPAAPVPAASQRSPERTVFASGTIEGENREVPLRFQLPGRLLAVEVAEGDRVEAGAILARLDPTDWDARLAEAEASLAVAEAERERLVNGARPESREVARAMARAATARTEQSKKELDRALSLVKNKSVSQQELDNLQAKYNADVAELDAAKERLAEIEADARADEVKMADARIAVAKAKVRQAKVELEKTRLRAPAAGLVLRALGEPGEMLFPERSDPILTMVAVDQMHARAYVEELDAFRLAPGARARVVADGLPNVSFGGTVIFCAPYMIPKKVFSNRPGERVDVKVREVLVRLDPQSTLVVGLPVDVYFEDATVSGADTSAGGQSEASAAVGGK